MLRLEGFMEIQAPLQRRIVQLGWQWPTQPRRSQPLKTPLDGAPAHLADRGDLARNQV